MGNRGQDSGPERGGWEAIEIRLHGKGRHNGHCMNSAEAECTKSTASATVLRVPLFQESILTSTLLLAQTND